MTTPLKTGSYNNAQFDVVIIGGGAAGIGVAASLLKRDADLSIAIVEPSDKHYYQPAWTLVGRGIYDATKTVKDTSTLIPKRASWIKQTATKVLPESKVVDLADGSKVSYQQLIVCPGLKLAWDRIEGLEATLGKNGVTSNYRYDLAPYTWELASKMTSGKAIFTQPPMPIKCAGAPQKAMYLSCDHWLRSNVLNNIQVELHNAGAALFGVAAFVPPLMKYVERYNAKLVFNSNLTKIDGASKTAYFESKDSEGKSSIVEKRFDFIHVVPPQLAPEFIKASEIGDAAGWCEVNQATLQHPKYPTIFALGDCCSAPNAKTVAAVRKQVVVVANNLIAYRKEQALSAQFDGYGACPLTVEKGKVILAEFGYGGKLLPTFPLNPLKARYSAWILKSKILPWIYWHCLLKGREWLTKSSIK